MKRNLIVFVLVAAASYAFLGRVMGPLPPASPAAPSSPVSFLIGGLVPPAAIKDADNVLARLRAGHCASGASPDVTPEDLGDATGWRRGAPVSVLCPGADASSVDGLAGYQMACADATPALMVRLGRLSGPSLVGCLVVVGSDDVVPLDGDASKKGLKRTFRAGNESYDWVEEKDAETGEPVDAVRLSAK